MSNLVIGTCKRSDMGWRRVSVNLHNLIKSFPFWNLTSNSEMGLFNLAATIWSHFFLCWCMEKTGYNISICTFLPQSPNKDTLVNFPNSRVLQTLSWKPVIPLSRSVPPSKPTLTHTSPWHIHVFLLAIPSNSVHLQKKKKILKNCLWLFNLGGRIDKAGVSLCLGDFPMLNIVTLCSTPPSLHNPKIVKY